jgi:hypothetical protein
MKDIARSPLDLSPLEKPAPCPHCRGEEAKVRSRWSSRLRSWFVLLRYGSGERRIFARPGEEPRAWVECPRCGTRGPTTTGRRSPGELICVDMWNRLGARRG